MKLREMTIALAAVAILGVASAQSSGFTPTVRSVRVETISTTSRELPATAPDLVANAGVKVETDLSADAIEKAKEAIRSHYARLGRTVRVDHEVNAMPPRSFEVKFRVIELCNC